MSTPLNRTYNPIPRIGHGIYTYADAAKILGLDQPKLRRWLQGYVSDLSRHYPAGEFGVWKIDGVRGFDFYTMIEAYVVAHLRDLGVPMRTIRIAREDLAERFETHYPFALKGFLSDGKKILLAMPDYGNVLIADKTGQMEFTELIDQYCRRIDFHLETDLVQRFWPVGKDHSVIVDPNHSFGRPSIEGTNISTEVLARYVDAGEPVDVVARLFDLEERQVLDAVAFEHRRAA